MNREERLERLRKLRIDRTGEHYFKSHYECLEWIDKVAPLLKYDQQHYNNFQSNAVFARVKDLSAARILKHLDVMISIVNQAIAELEMSSDSAPVPKPAPEGNQSTLQ